jgi:predicted RNA methylase
MNAADSSVSQAAPSSTPVSPKKPDVVFVPTPQPVVDRMLEMAEVKKDDIVYDLGCGDGRIVVTAAKKFGVKAIGVDIDPQRIREAKENVRTNGVAHLVTIKEADIFELDFSDATVVTLYLLPDLNVRLMPKLAKLKKGTRIVSNDFDMRGAKPKEVVRMDGHYDQSYGDIQRTIYKWVVPWEPASP